MRQKGKSMSLDWETTKNGAFAAAIKMEQFYSILFFALQRKKSEFIRSLNRPDEFLRMQKKENEFTWSANEFSFFTVDGWDPGVAHFLNYSFTFSQLSDGRTDGRTETEGRSLPHSSFAFLQDIVAVPDSIEMKIWETFASPSARAVVFIIFVHVVSSWQRNRSESMHLMKLHKYRYCMYASHSSVRSTNWKW